MGVLVCLFLGSAATLALTLWLTAAPSEAQVADGVIRIISLGDSYIAGNGNGQYLTGQGPGEGGVPGRPGPIAPGYGNCYQSQASYPHQIVFNLNDLGDTAELSHQACSGAEVQDLRVQWDGAPQQFRNTADVVLISAGGNDIGFGEIAAVCLLGNGGGQLSQIGCNDRLINAEQELPGTMEALRGEMQWLSAQTPADIAVVGYPDVSQPLCLTGLPNAPGRIRAILDQHDSAMRAIVSELNADAGDERFHWVPVRDEWSNRGGFCALGENGGFMNGVGLGPDLRPLTFREWYHPTQRGAALYSDIILFNSTVFGFNQSQVSPTCGEQSLEDCYRPRIILHPDEEYAPIDPVAFVEASSLRWWRGDRSQCIVDNSDANQAIRLDNELLDSLVTIEELELGYTFEVDCGFGPIELDSNDTSTLRPYDSTLPGSAGLYLDADDHEQFSLENYEYENGVLNEGVFYRRTVNSIEYWIFYGYDPKPNVAAEGLLGHEGDWENIEVVFENGFANDPTKVIYNGHGCETGVTDWEQGRGHYPLGLFHGTNAGSVERTLTHPHVYVAKGSHASYPRGDVFVDTETFTSGFCEAPRGLFDETSDQLAGTVIDVVEVDQRSWSTYAGGWGDVSRGPLIGEPGSGPAGPKFKGTGPPVEFTAVEVPEHNLRQVTDIANGLEVRSNFAVLGEVAYFAGDDGIHGVELWRTDGTTNGTYMVKDVNPGPGDSIFRQRGDAVAIFGSRAIFVADDEVHGRELWSSDGTEAGTQLIADINPEIVDGHAADSHTVPEGLVAIRTGVLSVADDGSGLAAQIWFTDGFRAYRVTEFEALSGSDGGLSEVNGKGYVASAEGTYEIAGPTGATRIWDFVAFDFAEGPFGRVGAVRACGPSQRCVVVDGFNSLADGAELYGSAGSTAYIRTKVSRNTAIQAVDFRSGEAVETETLTSASTSLLDLIPLNEDSMFPAVLSGDGSPDQQKLVSGHSEIHELPIPRINPVQAFSRNGLVAFATFTPESGIEAWITNGTTAGSFMLADLDPGSGSGVGSLAWLGDSLILEGSDGRERQLWIWGAEEYNETTRCGDHLVTVDLGAGDMPTSGDDVILGTSNDDVINSLGGNDVICGEGGDDTINAGLGNDTVFAGNGNDTVFGLDGDDTINGGPGTDKLIGSGGEDTLIGGPGADVLNGGPGNDEISGGDGDDEIFGQSGDDTLDGDTGNDLLIGVDGIDTINGGDGDDTINGGDDNDTINGDADDDFIFGLSGDDTINGGDGNDQVFGQLGLDTVDGGTGDDRIFGNEDDDELSAPSGANVFNGGPGNDTITGGAGDDQIFGDGNLAQAGNDTITGGDGTDLLIGFAGDDSINAADGVQDTVNGGPHTTGDTCTGDAGVVADTVFNCEP